MIAFVFAASALVLAVLSLFFSSLTPRQHVFVGRSEANLPIFREQMAALKRDKQSGLISEADFIGSRDDLQRRLLEEIRESAPEAKDISNPRRAILFIFLVPFSAVLIYMYSGQSGTFDPEIAYPQNICRLDDLKKQPEAAENWILLARACRALNRFAEAAEAFVRASASLDNDAALLADYAETLLRLNAGRYDEKIDALLHRALERNADWPKALFLAGASAVEREDFRAAADYWKRLLPQLAPSSKEAEALKKAVKKVQELADARRRKSPRGTNASRND